MNAALAAMSLQLPCVVPFARPALSVSGRRVMAQQQFLKCLQAHVPTSAEAATTARRAGELALNSFVAGPST